MESEGLVDPGTTEARIRTGVDFYFGNRFAQAWWKYESQRGYDVVFVELVNSALQEIDDERNLRWLGDLTSDMREL